MDFYFENQGTNTYLVYEIKADDSVDSMSLGMLTNNKIHGLAQTIFTQMDDKKFIKFNVSSKVSVTQLFAGAVNKKRLMGVFSGIVNAMLAVEDYMLDPASIIFDLNYIFTDVSTCETNLICLPTIDDKAKQVDLRTFLRNIMFNTQFDRTENCDHVASIINYLNGTPLFSITEFKNLLDDIMSNKSKTVAAPINKDLSVKSNGESIKNNSIPVKAKDPVLPPQHLSPQKPTLPPANAINKVVNVSLTEKSNLEQKQDMASPKQDVASPTISWFYLMQHYNKENAAAYKAQKEAKKRSNANNVKATQQIANKAEQPITPASVPKSMTNLGFAVPGQVPPPVQPLVSNHMQQIDKMPAPQQPSAIVQQPNYMPPTQRPQAQVVNFGETTVLGGGKAGETTVLKIANNPAQMIAPYLIRKKNNEKISLNKPVFRVGKEKSYVDYFIGDNTAISRSHADFITREGSYFVVDTNSTNHTYVNGKMIQSNVETAISHGDTVRLANEDFEFKLY